MSFVIIFRIHFRSQWICRGSSDCILGVSVCGCPCQPQFDSCISEVVVSHMELSWILLPNLQSIPVASLLLSKVGEMQLEWLPAISHIKHKLATITYKLLSVTQPTYLHLLLQQYQLTRSLRSGSQNLHCHPSLADMLSATTHCLYGTSYRYPSDLSTVSTHSNLI